LFPKKRAIEMAARGSENFEREFSERDES